MSGGRFVLIGHPVAHTLSPAMHNAAFAALGLAHRYEPLDVPPTALESAVERIRSGELAGGNVTIPHKERVVPLLGALDEDARAIGAVNTIVRDGERLVGHDTDGYGFRTAAQRSGAWPSGSRVLVLGAGGAARACVRELLAENDVLLANRSPERAERLAREIAVGGRHARVRAWPLPGEDCDADAVVNTTALGLHGEDPLAGVALPPLVLDIVPTREVTPLVTRALAHDNVRVMDGLAMLLHQAARSFELWMARPAPLEVMRGALPRPV